MGQACLISAFEQTGSKYAVNLERRPDNGLAYSFFFQVFLCVLRVLCGSRLSCFSTLKQKMREHAKGGEQEGAADKLRRAEDAHLRRQRFQQREPRARQGKLQHQRG